MVYDSKISQNDLHCKKLAYWLPLGRYDWTGTLLEVCKCCFLFQVLATELCSICENSLSCTLTICVHFCSCGMMRSFKFYKCMYTTYTWVGGREREREFFRFQVASFLQKLEVCQKVFIAISLLEESCHTALVTQRNSLCLSEKDPTV